MATLGYGTGIRGSNITTIGEVQSVGFSLSTDTADTTSTASQFASYVPTAIKANSIFISFLYDGDEVQDFVNEFKSKRTSTWTITFSDGVFSAVGHVSTVTVAAPFDGVARVDISINLTGEPSFSRT